MNRVLRVVAILAAVAIGTAWNANAEEFHTSLTGFKVVPAILTDATGKVTLKLDKNAQSISYTLNYSGLTATPTQAHLHFGKEHVAGGVIAFLCSNFGAPPGTPACPASGTVSGLITAVSVLAIPSQNVAAGNFDGLVRAMRSSTVYADVATTNFPAGEIRGEVRND
jgi:hypothetical protein